MAEYVGAIRGIAITHEEFVKLVNEVGCRALQYYCYKCGRSHRASSQIGKKHVEYCRSMDCSSCWYSNPPPCRRLEIDVEGEKVLLSDVDGLIGLLARFDVDEKVLKTLESIVMGEEFEVIVNILPDGSIRYGEMTYNEPIEVVATARFEVKEVRAKFIDFVNEVIINKELIEKVLDRYPNPKRLVEKLKMVETIAKHPLTALMSVEGR